MKLTKTIKRINKKQKGVFMEVTLGSASNRAQGLSTGQPKKAIDRSTKRASTNQPKELLTSQPKELSAGQPKQLTKRALDQSTKRASTGQPNELSTGQPNQHRPVNQRAIRWSTTGAINQSTKRAIDRSTKGESTNGDQPKWDFSTKAFGSRK